MSLLPYRLFAVDSSLSFSPPPSDYSVVFLGNIFGMVDGVLHGTSGQIMGSMFGVFNAAVLVLGGIVIIYTLLVSTLNTAHQGEMMGEKWSSIWVPVRATVGLALLIPKASGYCLMQVFVMWITLQGVGAADKVWNAALNYLNTGGIIIKAQQNPGIALINAQGAGIAMGAQTILAGQVCMVGLQKQLQTQREAFLSQKRSGGGPCSGNVDPGMKPICDNAVPDFLNSVNIVAQVDAKSLTPQTSYAVNMPNFDTNAPYASLNGVCGTIKWNAFDVGGNVQKITGVNENDLSTAKTSRAIAIQQMYLDLGMVAQVMVNNDPQLDNSKQDDTQNNNYSAVAQQQFGVPQTLLGAICQNATADCNSWNTAPGNPGSALFNGTEFQGAITDYNSIMAPTLNLMAQAADADSANQNRAFIQQASSQGWIMAGSYFMDLISLNVSSGRSWGQSDTNTGLDNSEFDGTELSNSFPGNPKANCSSGNVSLCLWLNRDGSKVDEILTLISGGPGIGTNIQAAPKLTNPAMSAVADKNSSTVYGFTNNAMMLKLPNQPGQEEPKFANLIHVTFDPTVYKLPKGQFDCGKVKIVGFSVCLGRMFGQLLYNSILVPLYNSFFSLLQQFINQMVMAFLMVPLQGMVAIFQNGLHLIAQPGVSPVVALAQMGTYYINFSAQVWMMMLTISMAASFFPPIFTIIALASPVVFTWLAIMEMIGFTTAYYVPLLPYIIFTFGSIAWLMSVIEAMIAAPIVALGVAHPEGHDAFGKADQAVMILMNIFLRPAMMVIGYISGIILSYVGVWILNAGFDHAVGFIQGSEQYGTQSHGSDGGSYLDKLKQILGGNSYVPSDDQFSKSSFKQNHGFNILGNNEPSVITGAGSVSGGYVGWAGIFAYFFSVIIYTMTYITLVQKSFTLITFLPDKILRWIGGQTEGFAAETAQWGSETQQKVESSAGESQKAAQSTGKMASGHVSKAKDKLSMPKSGDSPTAKGTQGASQSTPNSGDDS